MADFVTLTCPSCGGKLQITNDVERFACGHCGNEHLVRRSGGIVSLAPVIQEIKKIQTGVDKTASELAIRRLNGEIGQLQAAIATAKADAEARVAKVKADRNLRIGRGLAYIVLLIFFW